MIGVVGNIRAAVVISSILLLPLVALEVINRRTYAEGFPGVLFGVMWLLSLAFFLTLGPLLRDVRAGNKDWARPLTLVSRVAFLMVIAGIWFVILQDQMPCFLGVQNCD